MEAYPEAYIAHNLPLLVLSGLPQSDDSSQSSAAATPSGSGLIFNSDLPPLSGHRAHQILESFLKADGASLPWSEHALAPRQGLIGFNVATSGRVSSRLDTCSTSVSE